MLKKNLIYSLILSVSQFIFPLITFPYSLRVLGPQGIGTVNFIDSITQYFLLIAALGIPTYGIREIAKHRHDRAQISKLFMELLVIHLISTVVCAVILLAAAFAIGDIRQHFPLVTAGIALMFCSVFIVEWFYNGLEQFSYITLRATIVRALSIVALFLVLRPGSSSLTYYLIIVGTAAFTGILNIYNLRKHLDINFTGLEFKKHLKPLVTLLSAALAVSVYVLMDSIILGFIKGEAAVGIYSTAIKIVKLPFGVLLAINAVIIPQVSLAYQERRSDDIKSLISKSFALVCIIGLPICVGIYVSAEFLVSSFAGPKFAEAVPLLRILSPLTFIVGMAFISASQLLTPMGKEGILVRVSVIGMLISLGLNFLLIPRFSYLGAATTNILTEIFIASACFYFIKKFIDIKLDLKIFANCALAALAFIPIAALIRSFKWQNFLTDVIIIITCACGYAAYIWIFVKNQYVLDLKRGVSLKIGSLIHSPLNK